MFTRANRTGAAPTRPGKLTAEKFGSRFQHAEQPFASRLGRIELDQAARSRDESRPGVRPGRFDLTDQPHGQRLVGGKYAVPEDQNAGVIGKDLPGRENAAMAMNGQAWPGKIGGQHLQTSAPPDHRPGPARKGELLEQLGHAQTVAP